MGTSTVVNLFQAGGLLLVFIPPGGRQAAVFSSGLFGISWRK